MLKNKPKALIDLKARNRSGYIDDQIIDHTLLRETYNKSFFYYNVKYNY